MASPHWECIHNLICTAGLQRVEWPHLIGNVSHVGSLKSSKHVVHDEQWGTPLMTTYVPTISDFPGK